MSAFGDDLSNHLLDECENAKREGASVKDILAALTKVLAYLLEYWI